MVIDYISERSFFSRPGIGGALHAHQDLKAKVTGLMRPPYIVCPAGRIASRVVESLGEQCVAIADSDQTRWGTSLFGVPIGSYFFALEKYPHANWLVCSALHGNAIEDALRALGVTSIVTYPELASYNPNLFANREYSGMAESILDQESLNRLQLLSDRLADDLSQLTLYNKALFYVTRERALLQRIKSTNPMYFANDVVALAPESEIFFDLGAFTGDTLQSWFALGPKKFERYVAVEPDEVAYSLLSEWQLSDHRVVCIKKGISSTGGTATLVGEGVADSVVVDTQDRGDLDRCEIELTTIDDLASEYGSPTHIKMDIEGGERNAFLGGATSMSQAGTRLSVSAYHYPRDLWEIPLLLSELRPDSRVYLRHYTSEIDDTVCYVVD